MKQLKLAVQIQLAFHPCKLMFLNNYNITANSVEKHYFVVLSLKTRFQTF